MASLGAATAHVFTDAVEVLRERWKQDWLDNLGKARDGRRIPRKDNSPTTPKVERIEHWRVDREDVVHYWDDLVHYTFAWDAEREEWRFKEFVDTAGQVTHDPAYARKIPDNAVFVAPGSAQEFLRQEWNQHCALPTLRLLKGVRVARIGFNGRIGVIEEPLWLIRCILSGFDLTVEEDFTGKMNSWELDHEYAKLLSRRRRCHPISDARLNEGSHQKRWERGSEIFKSLLTESGKLCVNIRLSW